MRSSLPSMSKSGHPSAHCRKNSPCALDELAQPMDEALKGLQPVKMTM